MRYEDIYNLPGVSYIWYAAVMMCYSAVFESTTYVVQTTNKYVENPAIVPCEPSNLVEIGRFVGYLLSVLGFLDEKIGKRKTENKVKPFK